MARKQAGKKQMPTATETKPVRLDLLPETHRRLRVVAAEKGKSMAEYARDLVERIVNEEYEEMRR